MTPGTDLYRAFDLVPTPVRLAGTDGAYTFCNQAWLQFTGEASDPQRGGNWAHLVHPDDRERTAAAYAEAVRRAQASDLCYRLRRHDGEYRHLRESVRPLADDTGRLTGFVATAVDITDQQRADAILRDTRDRYRAFLETSTDAIWRFELDTPVPTGAPVDDQVDAIFARGWLAECNDRMAQMYGYDDAHALVGARLPHLMPPGHARNRDYIRRFVESGYRLTNEESHEIDRRGQPKVYVNSLIGIVDRGELRRAWGTQVDATAQREQEILLRQSDERLRLALGAAGMGTWRVDLRTGAITRDDSLNRILGHDDAGASAVPVEVIEVVHPDDRGRVRAAAERALREKSEYSEEMRIVRADGAIRWLRDRGRVVVDEDGSALFFTGAVMDITEQRRAEEYERLLAHATATLASSLDYERTLADVTRAVAGRFCDACAVYFSRDETIQLVAAAGDRAALPGEAQVLHVAREGVPLADDRVLVLPLRAGGHVFGAITSVAADALRRFDEEDRAFAAELADRVALAVDHARLFRDLQQASRLKDEFLATLSHELRTPLNAVLGWTRMLRRGTVAPDRTIAVLEMIERNAAAQMQLVEELLDLSAMVAGGLRLIVTRVDLRELLGGAVETVRPAADAKSLRVTLAIDPAVDDVAADPGRLRQVFWNLLSNAVRFTPPGGAIDVRVAAGPADVEITVRDSGRGIEPEFLPHVFEPFRQADSSSARSVGGLGLGLAIVRHIVEAHGGTVTVQSEGPERGSLFVVRLPTGRAAAAATEQALSPGLLRGRRVLAVDDDESTQELVATMLLMYGVSVRTAGRAAQALEILSNWRPDVLLTDLAMPGEDGFALMRRVRAMPAPLGNIPAVALTAYTDAQSVQHAFAAGFDAHLGKPLEPHVLADALVKVLRTRRASG